MTTTTLQKQPDQRTGSFSIKGWCEYRKYSIGTFYKMKREGVAPKITQPPGAPPRITQEADAEWVVACNNLPPDKAAKAEAISDERRERTRKAAKKSAASPHAP